MQKDKIDLTNIPWHKDSITQQYVERNSKLLQAPESMTPLQLAEATTYCNAIDNPYARELVARAGTERKFAMAEHDKKYAILVKATKAFGILLF